MYIQHSLSYAALNFHLNWLTFLEAMTDVLVVHFLSGHSVVYFYCKQNSLIKLGTYLPHLCRTYTVSKNRTGTINYGITSPVHNFH